MSSLLTGADLKQQNKTFYHDENLPSLPLPTVEQTLAKYLESCRAVLSEEDYLKTEQICKEFARNEAPVLHSLLLKRASEQKNWLEEWWLDKVYLETRMPLPLGNFSGPATYLEHEWPLQEGTQLERAAVSLYLFLQYWTVVRKERLVQHTTSDGKHLTMHQFRYLFNTCRIPLPQKDELFHCFQTEAEGQSPTHVIVLYKGYVFKISGTNPTTRDICTAGELLQMFQYVMAECDSRPAKGPGVAALTALEREKWYAARQHLIEIDGRNLEILKEIESSLVIISLDACSPQTYTEISVTAMVGEPGLRWYDKSYNYSVTRNGAVLCNCDHTPYDAMVMVMMVEFMTQAIKELKGCFPGTKASSLIKPLELQFTLDSISRNYISEAALFLNSLEKNIELNQVVFDKFGKTALKELRVHPDFMVQLCLQLAYMEVHHKPAPTYETATTRRFYHGRTETCRTCTPEVVAFCKAMLKRPTPGSHEYRNLVHLFKKAHSKGLSLMDDCMANSGCDRHLLGMLLICKEMGYRIPDVYNDAGFAASGGNGNFVLSTSCVGYFHAQGGVLPMVEHGYGFFYRINNKKIVYTATAFKSCLETSAQSLSDNFEYALLSVLELLSNADEAKL